MKKKISSREVALLVVLALLVVGICYYKFLYQPLTEKVSVVEADRAAEQTLMSQYLVSAQKIDEMQSVVDAVKESGEANPIPKYNNSTELMKELYEILKPTEQYTLTFNSVKATSGSYIVDRPVSLTFQTRTYDQAREVLDNIEGSQFVNQISDLSMTLPSFYDSTGTIHGVMEYTPTTWTGDNVQVSLSITFYELLG